MTAATVATPETDSPLSRITWSTPSDREMVATRVFDAPRRLVFEACSRPEHVRHWYGPRAMEMTHCEIDFRVGGSFRYVLRAPDGSDYAFAGEYREVVPPERVVNTWRFEAFSGSDTLEMATFEEVDGRTRLTVRVRFQTPEHFQGWAGSGGRAGMAETWDRLAERLAEMAAGAVDPGEADRETVLSRLVDAPRELVWKAWT